MIRTIRTSFRSLNRCEREDQYFDSKFRRFAYHNERMTWTFDVRVAGEFHRCYRSSPEQYFRLNLCFPQQVGVKVGKSQQFSVIVAMLSLSLKSQHELLLFIESRVPEGLSSENWCVEGRKLLQNYKINDWWSILSKRSARDQIGRPVGRRSVSI